MKRNLLFIFLLLTIMSGAAQNKLQISHGPYLQEVTGDGATFVFLTSEKSFSAIELKKEGADTSSLYYHTQYGFLEMPTIRFHSIRIEKLEPDVLISIGFVLKRCVLSNLTK